MISIIIITHYSLGDSYAHIMKHFFGENFPKNLVISSDEKDTLDTMYSKIEKAIGNVPNSQPLLILTDIFGATPCNVLNHFKSRPISIITGVNIPMVIKAVQDRDKFDDINQFSQALVKTAKDGIINYDLNPSQKC